MATSGSDAASRLAILRAHVRRAAQADHPARQAAAARELLAACPNSTWATFQLGQALATLARHGEALRMLRRALRANRANRDVVHHQLGFVHENLGQFDRALAHYRAAARCNPRVTWWPILVGGLLHRMGRLPDAARWHQQATRCRTGDREEAWLNLGLVRRSQGRWRDAATCFRRALRLSPKYPAAQRALRDVERMLQWRAKAVAANGGKRDAEPA
jgi:tetratricopeptide (TPR) repeat protein